MAEVVEPGDESHEPTERDAPMPCQGLPNGERNVKSERLAQQDHGRPLVIIDMTHLLRR